MNKIFLAILLVGILLSVGCATMKGLGQDISSLGDSIEGAAFE